VYLLWKWHSDVKKARAPESTTTAATG
jgi:hypothetical protein